MQREYLPKSVWSPLAKIMAEHFTHFCNSERYSLWEERRQLWDEIENTCRRMETGENLGSLKTLDTLRFIESLSSNPDPYFHLASYVISQPLLEDLIYFGGLKNLVEDFFLKQYGSPARFLPPVRPDAIAVRVPDITARLAIGHPSIKQIIRDFNKKTTGLWIVEFDSFSKGPVVFFTVQIPPVDLENPEMNHDMIRSGLSLINEMKGATA